MSKIFELYYNHNHLIFCIWGGVKIGLKNKSLINAFFAKKNSVSLPKKFKNKIKICCVGENNVIKLDNISVEKELVINIFGNNNTIEIGEGTSFLNLSICIGTDQINSSMVSGAVLKIGRQCSMGSTEIRTFNSNNKILIGDRCMFSSGIMLSNSDSHPVYEKGTTKIINRVKDLIIGNHCWVGQNATILKNSQIADDCIVGFGSVVSGKFLTPNCAIAGNPAKVIKDNINWDADAKGDYTDNIY